MHRKIFYLLLMLSLVPALLMASTKGRIKGTVVDLQTGEALIGANVIVIGTSAGAASDANGEFLLLNLEAGTYELRASYLGYQSITMTEVRVNADLTTYISFELPSEDVQVGTVEIVAKRPLIKKDATNAVRLTTSEDIEALPVRGVNNILQLQAGVTVQDGAVTIRGGRNDEVGFYLEGVSVTDPYYGGNAVTISQDALEEIQVQAGGYTAEFGGSNAGIIRQQLKSGGAALKASLEYQTDNITFKSREDAYNGEKTLGAYSYGYEEISGVLSGPLFDQRFKFFVNGNYTWNRDRNPQDWPGLDVGPIVNTGQASRDSVYLVAPGGPRQQQRRARYMVAGTITADLKPILLRLSGTYTYQKQDPFQFDQLYDMTRVREGEQLTNNGAVNLKLTHVLSPNMFYEISGGYMWTKITWQDPYLKDNYWAYGDSVANAEAGWIFERTPYEIANNRFGRYRLPYQPSVYGWLFDAANEVATGYQLSDQSTMLFAGNLNWMIGKVHSIKIGGEYKQQTLRRWALALATQTALASNLNQAVGNPQYAGLNEEQIKARLLNLYGLDSYGYDMYGNPVDDEGWNAPHKPVFASAYLTDRIEFEDIILNVGLRYDYIDVDNKELIDPTRPTLGVNATTGELIETGWQDVEPFSAVSPRVGISFPVTDRTVFHAQFGKFVQQTRLQDMYQGYDRQSYEFRQSYAFLAARGKNIRPTRTTQYELGFTQQLNDYMSFDITGYYRDIKDQVIFAEQPTEAGSVIRNYNTLQNGDYATTKGVEIQFNMRRFNRLAANAVVAFQDARGTGSNPYSNTGIVGAPLENTIYYPKNIAPLDNNNSLRANANLDYRFGPNDGPAFLNDFGASLLIRYSSGHPYTRGDGVVDLENDTRGRYPVEPLNESTTPSTFQIDLRLDKTFQIWDKLSANIYVRVVNLLDADNVVNVWLRTGTANDDGVLQDPRLAAGRVEEYGEKYVDAYKQFVVGNQADYVNATGNYLYDVPRQIILGVRLEY